MRLALRMLRLVLRLLCVVRRMVLLVLLSLPVEGMARRS
jgi:hypothetical protein